MRYIYIKRFFDLFSSILLLFLASPIFLTTFIALFFLNNGDVFFFQNRPGKNEKIFRLIKFKTMNNKKDKSGNLLSDEIRITRFGKFLRKTSIDELPQLINVIFGEMSIIGPRPLLVKYLPLYSKEQNRRHLVKPGITGWAQVNGRNAITWEEKFKLDVWYVENISILIDIKILLLTVLKVIQRKGINSTELITMEEFKGGLK